MTINFNIEDERKVSYQVADMLGKKMASGTLQSNAGVNQIQIDDLSLSNGLYVINIKTFEHSLVQKIIVK